jgi:hypothetical protein
MRKSFLPPKGPRGRPLLHVAILTVGKDFLPELPPSLLLLLPQAGFKGIVPRRGLVV